MGGQALELQIGRLTEQIDLQQQLRTRLEALAGRLRLAEEVSVEDLMHTMEVMSRMDQYYTAEQRGSLQHRREIVGDERIREVETTAWPRLIEEVRDAVDRGVDPASAQAQALARRWMALIQEFTGGDPGIERSLATMYQEERPQDIHPSLDPRMGEYMAFINKAAPAAPR